MPKNWQFFKQPLPKNCQIFGIFSKLFLVIFANNFAKFANFLVKIGNKIDLLSVNFPAKKLAKIAKNIAQGKDVSQLFGNC